MIEPEPEQVTDFIPETPRKYLQVASTKENMINPVSNFKSMQNPDETFIDRMWYQVYKIPKKD